MDLFEKLGYFTTKELWSLMKELGIMYCDIEDKEVENKETGELVLVPCFIPRTDYDGMKSDICVKYMESNREQKRVIMKVVDKTIKGRLDSAAGVEVKD